MLADAHVRTAHNGPSHEIGGRGGGGGGYHGGDAYRRGPSDELDEGDGPPRRGGDDFSARRGGGRPRDADYIYKPPQDKHCFNCGRRGHISRDCPLPKAQSAPSVTTAGE